MYSMTPRQFSYHRDKTLKNKQALLKKTYIPPPPYSEFCLPYKEMVVLRSFHLPVFQRIKPSWATDMYTLKILSLLCPTYAMHGSTKLFSRSVVLRIKRIQCTLGALEIKCEITSQWKNSIFKHCFARNHRIDKIKIVVEMTVFPVRLGGRCSTQKLYKCIVT